MLPDLSDTEKMAHIGRMTVLRKERREIVQKIRDKIVPLLNNIDSSNDDWQLDELPDLVDQVNAINEKIQEIN